MTEPSSPSGDNPDPAVSIDTDGVDSGGVDSGGVDSEKVATRAELLPEELAVGSDDPEAQAAAILLESEERTADPEAGI